MPIKLISLLKYWRYGLTILLTSAIWYSLHSVRIGWINSAHEAEISNVIDRVQKQCEAVQTKNNEVSNDYQSRLKDINSRHADAISRLLRHEANKCKGATASGFNAAATEGLSTEARAGIITSLAACDRQAEQLEGLQEWLR